MLEVHQFPCLDDNYGYLLHDPASGETACIDTPDADAYLREAEAKGWTITQIWNTHWHPDHAGGNEAIKAAATGLHDHRTRGRGRQDRRDRPHRRAWRYRVAGRLHRQVIDVGGHTNGHIAYHLPEARIAMVGDAVFRAGLRADVRRHRAAVLGEPLADQGAAAPRPCSIARTNIPRRTPGSRSMPIRTMPRSRTMPTKSPTSARAANGPCRRGSTANWPPTPSCAPTMRRCRHAGAAAMQWRPLPR